MPTKPGGLRSAMIAWFRCAAFTIGTAHTRFMQLTIVAFIANTGLT
jgi:hypothetical protein